MKKYEVTLTASATVLFSNTIRAETPEKAREIFIGRMEKHVDMPEYLMPSTSIQEFPHQGSDFKNDDVEVTEIK